MIRQVRADATAAELFRQLVQGAPILDGLETPVTTAAVTTVQSARHGLGRAYRGGWLASGDKAIPLTVLAPAGRAQPELFVYFQLASAVAGNATLWVY